MSTPLNTLFVTEVTPMYIRYSLMNIYFRASNSGGDTSTDLNNGDLELTVNIDDVNDNDPVFSTVSKCKAMSADAAGCKHNLKLYSYSAL